MVELSGLLTAQREWSSLSSLTLRELRANPPQPFSSNLTTNGADGESTPPDESSSAGRKGPAVVVRQATVPALEEQRGHLGRPGEESGDAMSGSEMESDVDGGEARAFVTIGLDGTLTTQSVPSYNDLEKEKKPARTLADVALVSDIFGYV